MIVQRFRLGSLFAVVPFFLLLTFLLVTQQATSSPLVSYTVSGRVTDEGSNPFPEVTVEAILQSTGNMVATTVTDSEGAYSLTLESATYDLRFIAPDGSGYQPSLIQDKTINSDIYLDVVLVSAVGLTLSGRVLDAEGNGVRFGNVELAFWEQSGYPSSTGIGSTGAYSLQALASLYRLRMDVWDTDASIRNNRLPQYIELQSTSPLTLSMSTILDLHLPPLKQVTVRVQDPAGNPVSGVYVSTQGAAWNSSFSLGGLPAQARSTDYGTTDGSGDVVFWLLPTANTNRYTFSAVPPSTSNLEQATFSESVTEDKTITITLPLSIILSGRVHDAEGNALQYGTIRLDPWQSGYSSSSPTSITGTYRLKALAGSYQVRVSGSGQSANSTTDKLPGGFHIYSSTPLTLTENTEMNLALPMMKQVTVRVQDPAGNPINGVTVSASTPTYQSVLLGSLSARGNSSDSGMTDGTGVLVFWLLPSEGTNSYRFSASPLLSSDFGPTSVNALITGDTQVTITLPKSVYLSGRLLDAEGNGISGRSVSLSPWSTGYSSSAATSSITGTYRTKALIGTYQVRVQGSGPNANSATDKLPSYFQFESSTAITLTENAEMDLILPMMKQVIVRVQDPAGNPISDIAVLTQNKPWASSLLLSDLPARGTTSDNGRTDASGNVVFWLLSTEGINRYFLSAVPPSGSPFVRIDVRNVSVLSDKTVVIVLQPAHTPPVTTISVDPAQDAEGYYSDPITVTLSATAYQGYTVAATYYRIDGGAIQTYSGPFQVSGIGSHTITYWSIDNSGVAEIKRRLAVELTSSTVEPPSPPPTCYELSTQVAPKNGGTLTLPTSNCTLSDGSGGYEMGTVLTIVANPATDYTFHKWSGTHGGSENPLLLTIARDTHLQALFYPPQVSKAMGNGGGLASSLFVEVRVPTGAMPSGSQLSIEGADVTPSGGQNDGFTALGKSVSVTAQSAQGSPLTSFASTPLELIFSYTDEELAAIGGNAERFQVRYFNESTGSWETFTEGRTVDATNRTVRVLTRHLSTFALQTESIAVSVPLEGRPATPHASYVIPLKVTLAGTRTYAFDLFTDEYGRFTLPNEIVPDAYILYVKGHHTLQVSQVVNIEPGAMLLAVSSLTEGDASNSNSITAADVTLLAASYNICQLAATYNVRADFNEDSCVTSADFSLLANNYNLAGVSALRAAPFDGRAVEQLNSGVALAIQPPTGPIPTGTEFDVVLQAQGGAVDMDTVSAFINFDPAVLEVVSIQAGSTLPTTLNSTFSNTTGQVDVEAGKLGAPFPTGTFTLATIRFRGIATSEGTALTFNNGGLRTSDAYRAGSRRMATTASASIIVGSPLAVHMGEFTVAQQAEGARISWETLSEADIVGFNLYRSADDSAHGLRLNQALIPAITPESQEGHRYEWVDSAAPSEEVHYYWLESVGASGGTSWLGPLRNVPESPTAVHLHALDARTQHPGIPFAVLSGTLLLFAMVFLRRRC